MTMEIRKGSFVKVKCPKCKNEQIVCMRATTQVKCLICNEILTEPKGGKAAIRASIIEVLS